VVVAAHRASPAELKAQLELERLGAPFLVYRSPSGEQCLVPLGTAGPRLTVGRGEGCDVRLDLDPEVSRLHAVLERLGDDWVLADDGLSRNGSWVQGGRVAGRRRLRDGDLLRFGSSQVLFRAPASPGRARATTRAAPGTLTAADLTDVQRRVLVALCGPYRDGRPYATPATNREIADALCLSVDAVKAHLRALFAKLDVEALPHNQKRVRLVERAFEAGLVSPRELFG
jgi:hypothetical protein